jgi:hypothetical protein
LLNEVRLWRPLIVFLSTPLLFFLIPIFHIKLQMLVHHFLPPSLSLSLEN